MAMSKQLRRGLRATTAIAALLVAAPIQLTPDLHGGAPALKANAAFARGGSDDAGGDDHGGSSGRGGGEGQGHRCRLKLGYTSYTPSPCGLSGNLLVAIQKSMNPQGDTSAGIEEKRMWAASCGVGRALCHTAAV